jgi:hypothetical protein
MRDRVAGDRRALAIDLKFLGREDDDLSHGSVRISRRGFVLLAYLLEIELQELRCE